MKIPVYWQTYGLENPNSGVFYYAHQIYESLRAAGVDPILVGSNRFSPAFKSANFCEALSNPFLGLLPKFSEPYISQKRVGQISGEKHRAIFHGLSNFNIPTLNRSADMAYVLTIHDLIPLLVPHMIAKSWAVQAKILIPLAARRADKIVCVSEWSKRTVMELIGISDDKIEVIPISIGDRVAEKSLPSGEKIRVLMISRDEAYKRLDLCCEIAKVAEQRLEITVVTDSLGEVRLGKKYLKLIEGGQLSLKTNQSQSELDLLYSINDVVINTSLFEGFGIPVAEALSLGIPTVITAGTGSEEFLNDEFSKKLSPEANPLDWANAIEEAFSFLKSDTWYSRIKKEIVELDRNQNVGQRYLSLYENLL